VSVTGIDIAWDRPSIAAIKATGAQWVARYFSPDPTKNLTAAEVTDYHAADLGIVTVWEGSATRALDGHDAGVADAQAADQQRASVGLPADMVIHFAVDTDTDWPSVAPYFDGVRSVLGDPRTGVYGGLKVIEGAHAAGLRYLWQTVAWSGGIWLPYATIQQPIGTTLQGAADYDTAEATDFGQYPRPEVNMPMTQADAELFAKVLLATRMPAFAAVKVPGKPDYVPTVAESWNGGELADQLVAEVKAELDTVKAAVGSAVAALQALSTAASPTVAEVQAAVQAELVKLGSILGGLK
jgi:hypothetical protein